MLTVITRWDSTQLAHAEEFQVWRQLRGAFSIDRLIFVPVMNDLPGFQLEQYETMEEALTHATGELVFLEPTGDKTVGQIPAGDITLVLGNTGEHNLALSQPEQRYRIDTDDLYGHLYGFNAAAVALAIRHGQ